MPQRGIWMKLMALIFKKKIEKFFGSYFELSSKFGEYVSEGISQPVFYDDLVYKLRRVTFCQRPLIYLSVYQIPLTTHFVWLRITDEGSLPELRLWSILLIESDLKWCIHLSRSLHLYFNYLVSVTAGGPVSPRGHMLPSPADDFGWFVAFREHQNFPYQS